MSAIGEAERRTQERIVKLFIDALHYACLGNFSEGHHENIIRGELEQFLALVQGYAELEDGDILVRRAVDEVVKVAGNTSLSPYDRNRAVYNLLRYGVIASLNASTPWLIGSLVHKFGGKEDGEKVGDIRRFLAELKQALPNDFRAKGDLYVFVDECHRTQSGDLHTAMTSLLPGAVFIGFTGTPLLKADKKKSIEIFGGYIHTYKFDEAVKDGVVLDLRYEARDIDQSLTSPKKIDQWFEAKTQGLTPLAKAQLKARWGTMQKVLSSQSRLQKIVGEYKLTASLVRAYANLANEMGEAGYSQAQAEAIKAEVTFYETLRNQVKLHSGDAIDLKRYEPAMRHLIDTYIRAEESEKVSEFEDLSLIQLIVERGADALKSLPKPIKESGRAAAETIENNVRKLIIDQTPINPKYYEHMSELLDALIAQRKENALSYQEYLEQVVDLTRRAQQGPMAGAYPAAIDSPARRALYDNLGSDEALAVAVDRAVRKAMQDAWRANVMKTRRVRQAIAAVLADDEARIDATLDLVKSQNDY